MVFSVIFWVQFTAQKQPVNNEPPSPEESLARLKKEYPEIINGVINFSGDQATIGLDNGKSYILTPEQPKSIYTSLGAEDGGRVKVQGKVMPDDKFVWILLNPI